MGSNPALYFIFSSHFFRAIVWILLKSSRKLRDIKYTHVLYLQLRKAQCVELNLQPLLYINFHMGTLKYLPVNNLRIGSTHLVWRSLYSTESDVRKGITKARILTGTYLLQKNRHSFSGGAVDPVCRHCRLEDEDLLHVLARCPAFFEIRDYTVQTLKDIVVRKTNLQTWCSYAKDWSFILRSLVCAETLVKA